ncbi:MAG: inositol monophosphatase [Anaerolineae bacterium]
MTEQCQELSLLHLAEATALLAGHYLKHKQDNWQNLEKAVGHDVKVSADRMAEELIVEQLCTGSNIEVFSEESGRVRDRGANDDKTELYWVVDPLDGSLNYHQGMSLCAVSIALYQGWDAILGVVYDFNHDELFSGLVGVGAWLNQSPIKPSDVSEVSSAVLGTGFPVNTDFSSSSLSRFVGQVQRFRKVRLLGSAALSLCYVACGRLDAYREDNIMFWDVAAGCALVQAAGGEVKMINTSRIDEPARVIAANGRLCLSDFALVTSSLT